MKWIVMEDRQTPETFIAVIGVSENRRLKIENERCSYFKNKTEAIARALTLKRELQVSEIKVFTPEES